MDLPGFCRTHHQNTKYTFFSATHVILFKVNHKLKHKAGFTKYKKIEKDICILSDHFEWAR